MKKMTTAELVTIALVAAILCILAPISIPVGFTPIPITLGWFAVVMAGIVLGGKKGTVCVLIYILLGAAGLPVFSGYSGGFQKILGPSGGYLWGYLFLAWLTGCFAEMGGRNLAQMMRRTAVGAVLGAVICYAFGTVWMGVQLHMTPMEALWAGVIPFVPLDAAKTVLALAACCPLRQRLVSLGLIPVKSEPHFWIKKK
ncbi:MAG: biotin transporter BioY [Lachnospiraceae bacterium]|nr:biotin transporter BioY [Lachnospiraceae bacterium]MCI9150221.1 biotin transporter BioY [Lachnospiraceae bacterium]